MYHGFQDYTLFSTYCACSRLRQLPQPNPNSIQLRHPRALNDLIITLPFNNFDILENTFRHVGHDVAAIIVEPCMGNCGAILPEAGFLELIREKTREYGVVFILDEVKTGFRIALGGAQEYLQPLARLATYAKSLGNGYPIAAFGGRRGDHGDDWQGRCARGNLQ